MSVEVAVMSVGNDKKIGNVTHKYEFKALKCTRNYYFIVI